MICRHRIERAAHAASALIRCCFPYRLMLNIFVTKRASPCISSDALHTLDRDPHRQRTVEAKSIEVSRSINALQFTGQFIFVLLFLLSLLVALVASYINKRLVASFLRRLQFYPLHRSRTWDKHREACWPRRSVAAYDTVALSQQTIRRSHLKNSR